MTAKRCGWGSVVGIAGRSDSGLQSLLRSVSEAVSCLSESWPRRFCEWLSRPKYQDAGYVMRLWMQLTEVSGDAKHRHLTGVTKRGAVCMGSFSAHGSRVSRWTPHPQQLRFLAEPRRVILWSGGQPSRFDWESTLGLSLRSLMRQRGSGK